MRIYTTFKQKLLLALAAIVVLTVPLVIAFEGTISSLTVNSGDEDCGCGYSDDEKSDTKTTTEKKSEDLNTKTESSETKTETK